MARNPLQKRKSVLGDLKPLLNRASEGGRLTPSVCLSTQTGARISPGKATHNTWGKKKHTTREDKLCETGKTDDGDYQKRTCCPGDRRHVKRGPCNKKATRDTRESETQTRLCRQTTGRGQTMELSYRRRNNQEKQEGHQIPRGYTERV